jgi:hypothetical protein
MRGFLASLLVLTWPLCGWAQFTYITNSGAITITGYTGSGGNVSIPSSINGHPVKAIGYQAFYLSSVTSVTIPNSVTSIGDYAFSQCSRLGGVTISTNVTSIGTKAFRGAGLTSVTIPKSVTSIGDYAFGDCTHLTSVAIPNSVTSLGGYMFAYDTSLTSANIPTTVTSIGTAAFYDCSKLNSVTIPNTVASIGYYAFRLCTNLHKVYFQGNAPLVNGGAGSADSTVFEDETGTAYYIPGTTGWGSTFGSWPTAGWYQSQPQILGNGNGLGAQSNSFQFTISWATNTAVVVESSTNLQNWTPVITNALVNGTNAFADSTWTNIPQQFYRVRSQ